MRLEFWRFITHFHKIELEKTTKFKRRSFDCPRENKNLLKTRYFLRSNFADRRRWGKRGGSWRCATAPRCMPGYVRCALVYKKTVARHFSLTDITHLNRKQVDPGFSRASPEGVQNDATRTECCLWQNRCRPDRSPFGLCTVTVRRTGAVSHWKKKKNTKVSGNIIK